VKKIPVHGGLYATVDDADYPRLSKIKWHLGNGYVVSNSGVRMHRLVLNAKKGEMVDHLNHRKRDNQRKNLRIVTARQNALNKRPHKNSKRGVRWNKKKRLYEVYVIVSPWMFYHAGDFKTRREAQERYEQTLSATP
jgi:hypothetical protein